MEYFTARTLHLEMIRYTPATAHNLSLFKTPFEQSLSAKNRWVRMADLVPWDKLAGVFLASMSQGEGRPSVDLRIVLGVLLVKHIEDLSDERTIEYIQENIYAQYFVGSSSFQVDPVFVPHLLVTIRKRLGKKGAANRRRSAYRDNRACTCPGPLMLILAKTYFKILPLRIQKTL
jgi:hypothetical protein